VRRGVFNSAFRGVCVLLGYSRNMRVPSFGAGLHRLGGSTCHTVVLPALYPSKSKYVIDGRTRIGASEDT
jgi:hypothetical protein